MLPQQIAIPSYLAHLAASYQRWTGLSLPADLTHAPFALVAHGVEADPIFCYANETALKLWEMSFREFTKLPSRLSAEPNAQEERARLLAKAEANGYVDDYEGIRISKNARRFRIRNCTLWNVMNEKNERIGQAAMFSKWEFL